MPAEALFDKQNRETRLCYTKIFYRAPAINADKASGTEATREPIDDEFEVLGTNATSADSIIATSGGNTISPRSATSDSTIILPHLDTKQSAWATTLWDTAKSPQWEGRFVTGSSIATLTIWAGLKLTNTPVIATDDDQVFFRYSAGVGSSWVYVYSIAGTDVSYTVPTDRCAAVAASTTYALRIEVYSDRTHMGFINGIPIASQRFAALTSLTTLIPYYGILADTFVSAATQTATCKYLECSRLY